MVAAASRAWQPAQSRPPREHQTLTRGANAEAYFARCQQLIYQTTPAPSTFDSVFTMSVDGSTRPTHKGGDDVRLFLSDGKSMSTVNASLLPNAHRP